MNNFSDLGLSPAVVEVLDQLGFTNPTPVQVQSIPSLLSASNDFIGLAQTGTGKTAAFGLPLVDLIHAENSNVQALILAPTRELGQQTASQILQFAKAKRGLKVSVVYGGANIVNQIKEVKSGPQIVVATPGRLIDLLKRKALTLDMVRYVVLDEADEMLNMGFQESIDEILSHTPAERKTWLFSATMPSGIRKLIKKYMTNPQEVNVNSEEKSNKDISHKYVVTKVANKTAAIRRFMEQDPDLKGIMFCRTKRETQQLADELAALGYGVEALHGDLTQMQRDTVMKRFKSRSLQLMVATDVAARGIDVNDLTHVFHHTLPDQLEAYTHRSGRTGRAGKKGISIAFINPRESRRIKELEKRISVSFEKLEVPSAAQVQDSRFQQWVDSILQAEVSDDVRNAFEKLKSAFDEVSKDELLQKLIALEFVNSDKSRLEHSGDLNEETESTGHSANPGTHRRYFINLGSVDGFLKSDMLHLLSDFADVDKKYFGEIRVLKNRSYFEVDKRQDEGFAKRFQGVEFENRKVTVHADSGREHQGSGRTGKRPHGALSRHNKNRKKHSKNSGHQKRRR